VIEEGTENIVGRLSRGTTVSLLEEDGAWCRIAFGDSLQGWVYGELLGEKSEGVGMVALEEEPDVPSADKPAPLTKSASMFPVSAVTSLAALGAGQGESAGEVEGEQSEPPVGTTVAASAELEKPVAPVPSTAAPQQVVHYTTFGRDPFMPHIRRRDSGHPNVEDLDLVGILFDRSDRIALLQDQLFKDKSYALREHDPVSYGTVWRINPDNVVFLITEMGISRTYTLELGEVSPTKVNATRGRS